jgi:predicted GTPase
MKEDLKELIIPSHLAEFGVKNLKILFMGLCGTGKSSTIDTMCSIFKGEYTCIQPIGNSEHTLTT